MVLIPKKSFCPTRMWSFPTRIYQLFPKIKDVIFWTSNACFPGVRCPWSPCNVHDWQPAPNSTRLLRARSPSRKREIFSKISHSKEDLHLLLMPWTPIPRPWVPTLRGPWKRASTWDCIVFSILPCYLLSISYIWSKILKQNYKQNVWYQQQAAT